MRIMMLAWEYPPRIVGGISPHVHELSQQLADQGVEVHVVTKATPLAPDEEVEPSGVHVHRVHLEGEPHDFIHEIQLLNVATEKRVRRLLEDWRPGGEPTIFHAHDWLSLDAARELKYQYKLPMVATIHATEEGRNGGIWTETQKYIHEQEYWLTYEAWRVIVCSQFMRGEVNRSFDVPTDKIDVIFNGIDATKFEFEWTSGEHAEWRSRFALPDEPVVMYVGRFVREKGIQLLLDAASVVLSRMPKAKFVIVGGGKRDHFERFANWVGLKEKVLFTGFMANRALHQTYRIADVAVFPSLYEPFGIVALEAMAAGVPVVASDAGGLREVVLHDQTGTLCYANNPESLAWAICRALESGDEARSMAQSAKERLRTDFDWSRLAEQTRSVYDRTWNEFLSSFWVADTLWPLSPGAEERAARLRVRELAEAGEAIHRPAVSRPASAEAERVSFREHETDTEGS